MPRSRWILAGMLLGLVPAAIAAEIGPGDDIEAAVASLGPGEVLELRAGTYAFDERIVFTAVGTSDQPITIRAKDAADVVLRQATTQNNVVEIIGSRHLVIRGIRFTQGSHGLRLIDSDFVTIEDCEIYETGDVALSANAGGTYEGLRILRNHIHHTNGTGEAMYLGCNNDSCRVANSLIEGNYIHDTNRASVEQGDGIEIKEGSYGNIVRDNVIHDTKYPGILVYSTVGNGPPNVIEGNVVWNVLDNTIQIAADAVVRNNIVLGNVSMQAHQSGRPSNIEFVHNTVVNDARALAIRDVDGPILIANNALYSQTQAISLISGDVGAVTFSGNVGSGGTSGVPSGYVEGDGISIDFAQASYVGRPPIDLFPTAAGSLVGSGDAQHLTSIDFNGTARSGEADVGAYVFDADGNPGWPISPSFKHERTRIQPNPPADLRSR